MKAKISLHDGINLIIIAFAMVSFLLIIAKLCNFAFVRAIDSTTLVAIPASIFAYFTYKVSRKQTHQIIIKQYTEHMEDFFDTWARYQNSFPLPKYLGIMKNNNEKIEDIIPNYLELRGKLMILKLRADTFEATEISMAMQNFWNKFLKSQDALLMYYDIAPNERNEANNLLSDNVIYFSSKGLLEMNNAYNEAIRKLQ